MINSVFRSSVFVSDYGTYNNQNPCAQAKYSGVCISDEPSDLIGFFELRNPNHIEVKSVNFEDNPTLLQDLNSRTVSQCEGMFEAVRHDHGRKHWVMLLELKHCQSKNVYGHVRDAYVQLRETYFHLCNVKKVIQSSEVNMYWVISTPEVENVNDSIDGSFFDQDELLWIKEQYHSILFYSNTVEVLTTTRLKTV